METEKLDKADPLRKAKIDLLEECGFSKKEIEKVKEIKMRKDWLPRYMKQGYRELKLLKHVLKEVMETS